jgi:hypothetical protein
MTNAWCLAITSACPLVISRVLWDGNVLVLGGPDWSFTCTSGWRVAEGERMIAGWEDKSVDGVVAELENLPILRCESLVLPSSCDLRLVLPDGRALEVFATSILEPWVFRLPAGPIIVPSPGHPGWYGAGD